MPVETPIDPAQAFEEAAWSDVSTRGALFPHLPAKLLLHAGPPFEGEPLPAVKQAAIQALRFERLAEDDVTAGRLLASGEVRLAPAQDHGIATPLAQVVSASMWLVAVSHGGHSGYGAMLEGGAPALRFGSTDAGCRGRLAALGELLTARLPGALRAAPVPLAGIIREAVAASEDCHSRTAAANAALVRRLRDFRDALDPRVTQTLDALPAFVLPVLMAAAIAALRRHHCEIEAIGGNGVDFGVRWRGATAWTCIPAAAPTGTRFTGSTANVALPAIGDSVVVDFCGLGGQIDDLRIRDSLRDPATGVLDPARIAATDTAPSFNLAILDAAGIVGLIGRGNYRPSPTLFARRRAGAFA